VTEEVDLMTTFPLGRYDTASATYTLQLKDVQRSDEGRYECQIIVGINNKVIFNLNLNIGSNAF
jgi:hypothetical protein